MTFDSDGVDNNSNQSPISPEETAAFTPEEIAEAGINAAQVTQPAQSAQSAQNTQPIQSPQIQQTSTPAATTAIPTTPVPTTSTPTEAVPTTAISTSDSDENYATETGTILNDDLAAFTNEFADNEEESNPNSAVDSLLGVSRETSGRAHRKKKNRTPLVVGIAVLVIAIVVAAISIGLYVRRNIQRETHESLVAACESATYKLQQQTTTLSTALTKTKSESSIAASDVDDYSTVTNLSTARTTASNLVKKSKALKSCGTSMSNYNLKQLTKKAASLATRLKNQASKVKSTASKVSASKTRKDLSTARTELNTKRQTAQTLYDSSDGNVPDGDTTRNSLKSAIDNADSVLALSDSEITTSQITSAENKLDTAISDVNKAVAQKEAEDKEEEEKENDASSQISSTGPCANYVGTYSDGSTSFTLAGNCTIVYSNNSYGIAQNYDAWVYNDNSIQWNMVDSDSCSTISDGGSGCTTISVTLSPSGTTDTNTKNSISVGGRTYTQQ